MKKIIVAPGVTKLLADRHKCSIQHVRTALKGAVESSLGELIRQTAKDWGYKETNAIPVYKLK